MTVPSDGVNKPRGKYWWIILARGIFALALGLGLFLPFIDSKNSLLNFMAIYWLLSGISSIGWGFRGARRKGVWFVAGLVGIIGGSVCHPPTPACSPNHSPDCIPCDAWVNRPIYEESSKKAHPL